MSKNPQQSWQFTNSRGKVIETHNAVDAEKYRHDPRFTEVAEPASKPYAEWLVDDLKAEIETRNTGRTDDVIDVPATAKKADLAAALDADDARANN